MRELQNSQKLHHRIIQKEMNNKCLEKDIISRKKRQKNIDDLIMYNIR